jgi:hypothetical protein
VVIMLNPLLYFIDITDLAHIAEPTQKLWRTRFNVGRVWGQNEPSLNSLKFRSSKLNEIKECLLHQWITLH